MSSKFRRVSQDGMNWPWKCPFLFTTTKESEITTLDGAPHCPRGNLGREILCRWLVSVTHSSIPDAHIWPHLQVAIFPSRTLNTKPSNCLLRHSETNRTEEEPPQPPGPPRGSSHMDDVTCYIWARSPSELGPLIRSAEHCQIIIANTMSIIIVISILLLLLLVPSYLFHLIIMLFMFWSLFR